MTPVLVEQRDIISVIVIVMCMYRSHHTVTMLQTLGELIDRGSDELHEELQGALNDLTKVGHIRQVMFFRPWQKSVFAMASLPLVRPPVLGPGWLWLSGTVEWNQSVLRGPHPGSFLSPAGPVFKCWLNGANDPHCRFARSRPFRTIPTTHTWVTGTVCSMRCCNCPRPFGVTP
jgi:hypothetical protein